MNKRKVLEAARKYSQRGKRRKALKEYNKLLQADPNEAYFYLETGDAHRRWGQPDEAVALYLKAANFYMEDGFDARAIAVFKQILNVDQKCRIAYAELATVFERIGLAQEAIGTLERAIDECFNEAAEVCNAESARALVSIARWLQKLGPEIHASTLNHLTSAAESLEAGEWQAEAAEIRGAINGRRVVSDLPPRLLEARESGRPQPEKIRPNLSPPMSGRGSRRPSPELAPRQEPRASRNRRGLLDYLSIPFVLVILALASPLMMVKRSLGRLRDSRRTRHAEGVGSYKMSNGTVGAAGVVLLSVCSLLLGVIAYQPEKDSSERDPSLANRGSESLSPGSAELDRSRFSYSNLTPMESTFSEFQGLLGEEDFAWFLGASLGATRDARNDSTDVLSISDAYDKSNPAISVRTATVAIGMNLYSGGFLREGPQSKTVFAKVQMPVSASSTIMTVGVEFPMEANRKISDLMEKLGTANDVIRVRDHTGRGRPFILTHYFWFDGATANTFHMEYPNRGEPGPGSPIFQQVEYASKAYVRAEHEQLKAELEPVQKHTRRFDNQ